jgi:hypothetical protein
MAEFRMFGGTVRSALVHAATQYDVRQEGKRGYNPYALAQYLRRIDDVCSDIERGADPRAALTAGFHGPLLNALLKAIGADKATPAEQRGDGQWSYRPVT